MGGDTMLLSYVMQIQCPIFGRMKKRDKSKTTTTKKQEREKSRQAGRGRERDLQSLIKSFLAEQKNTYISAQSYGCFLLTVLWHMDMDDCFRSGWLTGSWRTIQTSPKWGVTSLLKSPSKEMAAALQCDPETFVHVKISWNAASRCVYFMFFFNLFFVFISDGRRGIQEASAYHVLITRR